MPEKWQIYDSHMGDKHIIMEKKSVLKVPGRTAVMNNKTNLMISLSFDAKKHLALFYCILYSVAVIVM